MSAEHGAYVELLQKGEIKRDLAGVSGCGGARFVAKCA